MNRTRWLVGMCVLTLCSLMVVACQGTPVPTAQPTEPPAAQEEGGEVATAQPTEEPLAEATPVPEEKITLTVWDFGGAEFQWMDEIVIPAYQELHPEIVINHVGIPEDELGLKLETAIAAGEVPDLAVFVPSRVVKAGHVLFLDAYMERDGLSRDDYCPLFYRDILDDKVFALPMDTNIWAMMYNKDLFAAAGLPELGPDDVITFDDWLTYARAIDKPADNLADRVWGSELFYPSFNSMNNYMSDPYVLGDDGRTCEGNANTDDWMHFWEIQVTAYKEDVTTWSAGAMLADVEEDMFLQGKVGMTYAALGDALYAKQNGINVGLTGQPVVSEGWEGNVGGWNTDYSIMAGSKHPDEAWEFLKWLSTEALKIIPIGTDTLASGGGGGLPGLPCYLPLLETERMTEMIASEPLVADAVKLMQRIKKPPFTPDIWTSVEPFGNAWTAMIEEDVPVPEAVNQATEECQEITDQLWRDYEALGQ